jgi:hypothetical protein
MATLDWLVEEKIVAVLAPDTAASSNARPTPVRR